MDFEIGDVRSESEASVLKRNIEMLRDEEVNKLSLSRLAMYRKKIDELVDGEEAVLLNAQLEQYAFDYVSHELSTLKVSQLDYLSLETIKLQLEGEFPLQDKEKHTTLLLEIDKKVLEYLQYALLSPDYKPLLANPETYEREKSLIAEFPFHDESKMVEALRFIEEVKRVNLIT